jgi:hypothetical protein
MLPVAGKYTDLRAAVPCGTAGPHVRADSLALAKARDRMRQFGEFELRVGEYAQNYLRRERAGSLPRQRAVARAWHAAKPKWGELRQDVREAEVELKFAVDARTYWRWFQQEGPEFWGQDSNLRALKRDNPEMCIFV